MLKKIHLLGVSAFIIALLLSACQNSEYAGFSHGNGDLLYKIHKSNKGAKAKPGDYLSVQMDYRTNEDSLLFDSHGKTFPLELVEPVFAGDINDALQLLAEGDSATFVIRADSFLLKNAKMIQLPKFVNEDSKIIFDVKLHDIQTLEEITAAQAQKQAQAIQQEADAIKSYTQHHMPEVQQRPSGLFFKKQKQGKGKKAKVGSRVKLHYTGKFLNGRKFASSYDNNKPISFTVGKGEVIDGWDEGVSLMQQGDEAILVLPSSIAYKQGRGQVPANTPLVFEVKLLEVK